MNRFVVLFVIAFVLEVVNGKYVEGHLKTLDDWAFLARFCFISGRGRYEYLIEYEKRYGDLQLLLYYDDDSQWPAAYKTDKNCKEKISVLRPEDNQIVTLSAKTPFNVYSGCTLRPLYTQNPQKPTNKPKIQSTTANPLDDITYYDQFLKTSTVETTSADNETHWELFQSNKTDSSNSSDMNSSESSFVSFMSDINSFENSLDNSTSGDDVEELFDFEENHGRIKRGLPRVFDNEKRGTVIVSCRNVGGFTSSRERWWYIAIANCGSGKGMDVKYKFRMTNGPPGDFWHEHFSADEMYIPPILMAFSMIYTFLLLATFLCGMELKSKHLYHCTYRLFTFSAMLEWAGILFNGVTWTKYAVSGMGPYPLVGGLFMGGSEITFLALLLIMAKGYTITRGRLSTCSTIKLTVYINSYIVVYISLFIFQSQNFDPGEVLNLYESPAGLGLACLRGCAWVVFMCSCIATVRKFPEKSTFYYPFGLLGSMWILSGPILTIIGVALLDKWVRESVMFGALATSAFLGHATFLWLTWPSRANKSFPYHVRTNHVGIINVSDDGTDFPRHTYAPSAPDHSYVIPLSRTTDQLTNEVYSQYLSEREYFHSASTPNSHISFPIPAHAPSMPQSLEHVENTTSNDIYETPRRREPDGRKAFSSGENENLYDSGHPSIDSPNSSGGTGKSLSRNNTPPEQAMSDEREPGTPVKPNPFVTTNMCRLPNKIILEPLEHTASSISSPSRVAAATNVPKHLFAAKKI